MRKNNILVGVTILISSLIIGCGDKSILLNDNVKVEQARVESSVVVKEKDFKLEIENGVSFDPVYIGDDGVYGLTYIANEEGYRGPTEDEDYILKRVSEDGIVFDTIHNIRESSKLPYALKLNDKNEIVYTNYFKSKEKVIMKDVLKGEEKIIMKNGLKSSGKLDEGIYIRKEVIQNSQYAVIEKVIDGKDGEVSIATNIINLETGDIFSGGISYGDWRNRSKTYFYIIEKNAIYSIDMDGVIKRIILKDGKIEEDEYDRIKISDSTNSNDYRVYSHGLETRIIYNESNLGSSTVVNQLIYKVSTKEYEVFYDKKSTIGSFLNIIEMLPSGFMIGSINGDYMLIKFEEDGMKLIHRFDFSNEISLTDEVLERVEIVSDENCEEIIIKLVILNNKSKEKRDEFKMYEIIT